MHRLLLIVAAALLLAGCDKETTLHAGLEERQANLVMAALRDAGITCHKEPGEEGTWNVMVAEPKFAEAVNHYQALRIKAAILQDAALQQELLGDWNFFDTSFPVRYPKAACQYRNTSRNWQRYERTDADAMVVNIESGGRYVATVCRERINDNDLWVCYPIYEGKVKLACGVGVDSNQNAYDVKWVGGKVTVTPRDDVAGVRFYITNGAVRVKPTEGVTYAESHTLPAVAMAGGVQPDGSYSSAVFPVKKNATTFYFEASADYDNAVGWQHEAGTNVYKRNDNYTYIYNPNEIKYE